MSARYLKYPAVGLGLWLTFAVAGSGVSRQATRGMLQHQLEDLGFHVPRERIDERAGVSIKVAFPVLPFLHFAYIEFSGGSCAFTKSYLFLSAGNRQRVLWEAGG
jgi:hypothetical protein